MVFIDTWLLKMAISYFFFFLNNKSVNPITTWACSNTTPLHSISKTVTPSHDLTFTPNAHGKLRHSENTSRERWRVCSRPSDFRRFIGCQARTHSHISDKAAPDFRPSIVRTLDTDSKTENRSQEASLRFSPDRMGTVMMAAAPPQNRSCWLAQFVSRTRLNTTWDKNRSPVISTHDPSCTSQW